jgi:putative membrane protein
MMKIVTGLVFLVGLLHVWFLILEMFLWTKPFGRKTFGLTPEFANLTQPLAANQGLYNGFLAAGLFWGAVSPHFEVKIFFLTCVVIAGVYGALTVNKKIFFIQALPALIASFLVWLE